MPKALDYKNYQKTKNFSSLDGLRCFCILAVIWHHTKRPPFSLPMADRGFIGVDMFFVLSGFLIVTLLLREKSAFDSISLKNFYIRRTLRIFPIYYGLLLFMLAYYYFKDLNEFQHYIHRDFIICFFYLSNWFPVGSILGITWSLATEEQFYLLWPPIEKLFSKYALPLIIVLIVICECVNFRLTSGLESAIGVDHQEYAILQVTFAPICLGVLLAHLLHFPSSYEAFRQIVGKPWMPLIFLAGLLIVVNIPGENIAGTIRFSIHLLMTGLLASCVINQKNCLTPILENACVKRIGMISYGMYLYHLIANHFVRIFTSHFSIENTALYFVLLVLLTIAISEASYRIVEQPILRFKTRWSRGSKR